MWVRNKKKIARGKENSKTREREKQGGEGSEIRLGWRRGGAKVAERVRLMFTSSPWSRNCIAGSNKMSRVMSFDSCCLQQPRSHATVTNRTMEMSPSRLHLKCGSNPILLYYYSDVAKRHKRRGGRLSSRRHVSLSRDLLSFITTHTSITNMWNLYFL